MSAKKTKPPFLLRRTLIASTAIAAAAWYPAASYAQSEPARPEVQPATPATPATPSGPDTPASPATPATPGTPSATPGGQKESAAPTTEAEFMTALNKSGRAEKGMLELAAARTTNPEVKKFVQTLLNDYETSAQTLQALNRTLNLQVPETADAQTEKTYRELSGLTGAAFDAVLVREMQTSRTAAIANFEAAAKFASNPQVRSYIETSLPNLRRSADRLRAGLGGNNPVNPNQTNPGTAPGTTPPGNPGTNPGNDPGVNPGANPDTSPGSNPGTNPRKSPGSTPPPAAPRENR